MSGNDSRPLFFPLGTIQVMMPDGTVRQVKVGDLDPGVLKQLREQGLMRGTKPNTLVPADLEEFEPPPGVRERDLLKEMLRLRKEDFQRAQEEDQIKNGKSCVLEATTIAIPISTRAGVPGIAIGGAFVVIGGLCESLRQENVYMARSISKGENWASRLAKTRAMTKKVDPCDVLEEMMATAKAAGNSKHVADILEAMKYLGCHGSSYDRRKK
jgi:hypothetical protein